MFDPCVQLNETNPRVPVNEDIDNPYKTDLYDSGTWSPQSPQDLQNVE